MGGGLTVGSAAFFKAVLLGMFLIAPATAGAIQDIVPSYADHALEPMPAPVGHHPIDDEGPEHSEECHPDLACSLAAMVGPAPVDIAVYRHSRAGFSIEDFSLRGLATGFDPPPPRL